MKWQYKTLPLETSSLKEDSLNFQGEQGWELVATMPLMVFKRPVGMVPAGQREKITGLQPKLLKISEVASLLGISRTKVYEVLRSGRLQSVRIGTRAIRIPAQALDEWIAASAAYE